MRKLIYIAILVIIPSFATAEMIELSTYYPAPYGSYDRLRLVPRAPLGGACQIGTFYVENMNNSIQFCADGTWGMMPGVWYQDNQDDATAVVYPMDTSREIKVGIGAEEPKAFLHINAKDLANPVDWDTSESGGLGGELIIEANDANINIVSENSSAISSHVKLSEVSDGGSYLENWTMWKETRRDGSRLFFGYGAREQADSRFWIEANTKLTITPDGKMGIGTKNPEETLHVAGNGEILLEDTSVGIEFRDTTNDDFRIRGNNDNALKIEMNAGGGWNPLVAIKSDGYFGIGTTSPQTVLHVETSINEDLFTLESNGSAEMQFVPGNSVSDGFGFWATERQFGINENADGKNVLRIRGETGRIGINEDNPDTMLHVKTTNNTELLKLTSDASSELILEPNNGTSEVFTIYAHSGHFGINDDTGGNNLIRIDSDTRNVGIDENNPSYKLDVNGTLRAFGITDSSDVRLKKDIGFIEDPLDRIVQLRGVNYRWKDEKRGDALQIGLIAQEVEEVFPEVVSTDEKGFKSIAYGKLVGALIEAIKEQQKQIENLKKQIEELK